jgi:hypothetical protein
MDHSATSLYVQALANHEPSVPQQLLNDFAFPAGMPVLDQEQVGISTDDSAFRFDDIQEALQAFARGEFLLVMDDENRENEGDLIIAASHCTTEKMAWMIKHTRLLTLPNFSFVFAYGIKVVLFVYLCQRLV